MTKNEQELKKEIRVENKRSSDNLNQVTVGFSKIVKGVSNSSKFFSILI